MADAAPQRFETLMAEYDAILAQEHVPASAGTRLEEIADECLAILGGQAEHLPGGQRDEQ